MKLLLTGLILLYALQLSSQAVGVNESGDPPHSGAILDVNSGDKGVLLPRTTSSAITSPVEGMVIYDTVDHVFKYYDGTLWTFLIEANALSFFYGDEDGDGYGSPFKAVYAPAAPPNGSYVADNMDCDDDDSTIHPAASEVCDSIDNDCDGLIDDDDPSVSGQNIYWEDMDGDHVGNPSAVTLTCSQLPPPGYEYPGLVDCDDANPAVYEGAVETCDGVDNDCDGLIDGDDPDYDWCACEAPCETEWPPPCFGGSTCTNQPGGYTCSPPGINSGYCFIGMVCYSDMDPNPSNECQWCDSAVDPFSWTPKPNTEPCGTSGMCDGSGNCIE